MRLVFLSRKHKGICYVEMTCLSKNGQYKSQQHRTTDPVVEFLGMGTEKCCQEPAGLLNDPTDLPFDRLFLGKLYLGRDCRRFTGLQQFNS